MLYYADGHLLIRDMTNRDAEAIAEGERAQGWVNASPEKYFAHMRDRQAGRCSCLVAVATAWASVSPAAASVWRKPMPTGSTPRSLEEPMCGSSSIQGLMS